MAPDYVSRLEPQMQAMSGISSMLDSLKPSSAMLEAMKGPSITSAMLEAIKGPSITSAMLEAMKGPSITSAMLEAMKGPSITSAMLEAMKGPSITSAMLDGMNGLSITSAMLEATRVNSTYLEVLKGLGNSVAMQAIKGLKGTPFDEAVVTCTFANLGYESGVSDAAEFVLDEDSELVVALQKALDFSQLSERAKAVLFYLYQNCLLPFVVSCLATVYMTHYYSAQNEIRKAGTSTEVKALARKGSDRINKDLLKGYRVVIAPSLQLRGGPGMQSEILTVLPLGQLIEVLHDSKRSWLHVQVNIEGEILDGWTLRRYTTNFK